MNAYMIDFMQPKNTHLKDRHKNLRLLVLKETVVHCQVRLPYFVRLVRGLKIDDLPQVVLDHLVQEGELRPLSSDSNSLIFPQY